MRTVELPSRVCLVYVLKLLWQQNLIKSSRADSCVKWIIKFNVSENNSIFNIRVMWNERALNFFYLYTHILSWLIIGGEPMGVSGQSLKIVVLGLYCDWLCYYGAGEVGAARFYWVWIHCLYSSCLDETVFLRPPSPLCTCILSLWPVCEYCWTSCCALCP